MVQTTRETSMSREAVKLKYQKKILVLEEQDKRMTFSQRTRGVSRRKYIPLCNVCEFNTRTPFKTISYLTLYTLNHRFALLMLMRPPTRLPCLETSSPHRRLFCGETKGATPVNHPQRSTTTLVDQGLVHRLGLTSWSR